MAPNMFSPDCPHAPIVEIPLRFFMELMQLAPLTLQARLLSPNESNPGILLSAWYYWELLGAAGVAHENFKDVIVNVPLHEDDEYLDLESEHEL